MFPLTRKPHSEADHVFLFLVALEKHFVDFLLESDRLGDDGRKIIERQSPPLTELASIERQRGGRAESEREQNAHEGGPKAPTEQARARGSSWLDSARSAFV